MQTADARGRINKFWGKPRLNPKHSQQPVSHQDGHQTVSEPIGPLRRGNATSFQQPERPQAIRKLCQQCDGQQPAEAIEVPRLPEVAARQRDAAASQTATGAFDAPENFTGTQFGKRRPPPQLNPLIRPDLQQAGQHDNRRRTSQHQPMVIRQPRTLTCHLRGLSRTVGST